MDLSQREQLHFVLIIANKTKINKSCNKLIFSLLVKVNPCEKEMHLTVFNVNL